MVKTRILTNSVYTYNTAEEILPVVQPELQLQASGGAAVLAMAGSNSTVGTSFAPPVTESTTRDETLVSWNEEPSLDSNPFQVAKKIVEQEGWPVLFTGVYERCGGAIPRFGITLGAHEWLEHYASTVGLLSQSMS